MPSNSLSGYIEALDRQAEERKAYLERWNHSNKPIAEKLQPESQVLLGVFRCGDQWYFGDKYANGYHPEKLIEIPQFVVQTIVGVINEK